MPLNGDNGKTFTKGHYNNKGPCGPLYIITFEKNHQDCHHR
jgi:hypothetical protein